MTIVCQYPTPNRARMMTFSPQNVNKNIILEVFYLKNSIVGLRREFVKKQGGMAPRPESNSMENRYYTHAEAAADTEADTAVASA